MSQLHLQDLQTSMLPSQDLQTLQSARLQQLRFAYRIQAECRFSSGQRPQALNLNAKTLRFCWDISVLFRFGLLGSQRSSNPAKWLTFTSRPPQTALDRGESGTALRKPIGD